MNLLRVATRVLGVFGAGRSPAALLNFTVPRRGYKVLRDIAYGTGLRHRLDLYLPESTSVRASDKSPADREENPVVVFFYGGAFRAGRKSEYRFVGEALATAGIIVAVPDYRIYPEARFPDFLQDGAQAVTRVREIAAYHGGNSERLFIAGHSAGAYIAVMLAADERWLRRRGSDGSWVRGVIGLSGRYHDSPTQDEIANVIFQGPPRDETRPASFIRGRCPPMLLAAGSRESGVVLASKQNLAAHLRQTRNEVEETLYAGVGHAGIVAALAPGFRGRAPVRADIIRFVNAL